MDIKQPFNLFQWIEKNRHLLKPPVGNKNLYVEAGDYIVMIVAGPNARKDYHYNETEELFFLLIKLDLELTDFLFSYIPSCNASFQVLPDNMFFFQLDFT